MLTLWKETRMYVELGDYIEVFDVKLIAWVRGRMLMALLLALTTSSDAILWGWFFGRPGSWLRSRCWMRMRRMLLLLSGCLSSYRTYFSRW
jgi:hypothetical protein